MMTGRPHPRKGLLKLLAVAAAVWVITTGAGCSEPEKGRYTSIANFNASGFLVLDTHTGKVWYFDMDSDAPQPRKWKEIAGPIPKGE